MVALLVVLDGPQRARVGSPSPSRTAEATQDRDAAGADLVDRLQRVLRRGDPDAAADLGGSVRGAARLRDLVRNVRTLGIDRLDLRYVAAAGTPAAARFGSDAWTADVQVAWRLRGRDRASTTVEVPFVLGSAGRGATFLGVEVDPRERVPLWLTAAVDAASSARTLAIATTPTGARRVGRLARVAVATVERTLPAWGGQLVVEAPPTLAGFEAASGLPERQAQGIAAVTTATEPADSPDPPVHVFLNPRVFDPLGPRGQQIVLSHEATHVAVGAAPTDVPLWLSEGFADYVALRFSPLSETVIGAQVAALVREDGAPAALPSRAQFAGDNPDVGAWYEGAWIAVDLLGERYGTDRLLRLYRAAERVGAGRAFRSVLGTTLAAFERTWTTHLQRLAS